MKTSDQIYDEVAARWSHEKAERRKKIQNRASDVLFVIVPFAGFFIWALVERQTIVTSICPLLLVGSLVQLQKRWRLEARVEQLENER